MLSVDHVVKEFYNVVCIAVCIRRLIDYTSAETYALAVKIVWRRALFFNLRRDI